MLDLGADSFWYYDIDAFVFAGEETALSISGKRYETAHRIINENDIITIDLSPQNHQIWGDYARTLIVEKGQVVNCIEDIHNQELVNFVTRETTFEELYDYMNTFLKNHGYINLDFLGNLGHSIAKESQDRIYIEKGNTKRLSAVKYFTFEPHISTPHSQFGYKKENIYYFHHHQLYEL